MQKHFKHFVISDMEMFSMTFCNHVNFFSWIKLYSKPIKCVPEKRIIKYNETTYVVSIDDRKFQKFLEIILVI